MASYKTWLCKGILFLGSIESSLVFLQLSRIQMLRFIINLVENLLMRSLKNFIPLNSGHLVLNINTGIVKFKLELKLTLSHPFKHKSAVIFNQSWQISENINESYICM